MIHLSKTELTTFDRFTDWVENANWIELHNYGFVVAAVKEIEPSDYTIRKAAYITNRILENLKLREDTRDVLVKIQYALDLELTKLGGEL